MKVVLLALASMIGATACPNTAAAQETTPPDQYRLLLEKIDQLEKRVRELEAGQQKSPDTNAAAVQELDQKIRVLERNGEIEKEAAGAAAKETPKITIGEKGFGFASADGSFGVQLKGLLQVDSRTFFEDSGTAGNDGFLLRRARPILQGTVFRDFDFVFTPDFGGTGSPQILDASLNYRYSPALQLLAGKFKAPVGYEQLLSDKDVWFNERSLVTDLVPNRDLGFQVHGGLFDGSINYAAGIFNGIGDGRNSSNADFDDNKSFAGRLFLQPFKTTSIAPLRGLGFGAGGSYEDRQGRSLAGLPNNIGYATVGQQLFFAYNPATRAVAADGTHWRLSPQASYFYGPLGVIGEYAISSQRLSLTGAGPSTSDTLEHTAWQVAVSYVLTGEDASPSGIVPRHAFNPRQGHWGAWQLAARYSQLDLDADTFPLYSNPLTSASAAHEWSVGLNWYLNRNVRFSTSFSHTWFEGGGGDGAVAPAAVTRQDENVLFTRIQLAF